MVVSYWLKVLDKLEVSPSPQIREYELLVLADDERFITVRVYAGTPTQLV
jgi:hypothetical protein